MSEMEPEHLRKVFVGGLPPATTDESMRAYFCKYGEIVDVIVMKDSQTRRSRGFGFVAFDKSDCVDQLQNERPHVLDGKEVDTKRVVPKTANASGRSERVQKGNKIFVGGLREELSEDDIRLYFESFGNVERVETFTDKVTNRRKGFGFVTFNDFDSVDKCIIHAESTPNHKLSISGVLVEVKRAKSQEEMNGGRGGSRGGGSGFGSRGGGGGFGDFGNQGYSNNMNQGFSAGYNQGGGGGYAQGGGGGGGYNQASGGSFNQGGFNSGYNQGGGGGGSYGGGDGYSNSGSLNSGGGWNQQQQQQQGSGYSNNSSGGGYGSSGGMGSFGSSDNGGGGYGGNSGGGGPMRDGLNKGTNRSGPYGGGNSGWKN